MSSSVVKSASPDTPPACTGPGPAYRGPGYRRPDRWSRAMLLIVRPARAGQLMLASTTKGAYSQRSEPGRRRLLGPRRLFGRRDHVKHCRDVPGLRGTADTHGPGRRPPARGKRQRKSTSRPGSVTRERTTSAISAVARRSSTKPARKGPSEALLEHEGFIAAVWAASQKANGSHTLNSCRWQLPSSDVVALPSRMQFD